jgi:two-component system phosphate regulon response regulator PhoB
MSCVLVIEDDSSIAKLLSYNLSKEGYSVMTADTGEEGLRSVKDKKPDLIILDLMLPGVSGLEVCRLLKEKNVTQQIPVIMLTAKSEELDKIAGWEAGADDYVTKPFSVRELLLRVKAILKRCASQVGATAETKIIVFKALTVDSNDYHVTLGKKKLNLTITEFKLLAFLLTHPNKTISRDHLLNRVWGYQSEVFSRTVDTHITRLRSKLQAYGKYLMSVRSIGYRWEDKAA